MSSDPTKLHYQPQQKGGMYRKHLEWNTIYNPEIQETNSEFSISRFLTQFSELTESPSSQQHFQDVRRELILLSLPAIAGQALEPLAQLMETAYIARLGPVELVSAGVSMSIFNIISKLFNMPLLSVATSFVAEDLSKIASRISISEEGSQGESSNGIPFDGVTKRQQLSSVSLALILAVAIGIFEALALSLQSGLFLNLMGISSDFSMSSPAQGFLSLRALGAPALVVSLALQSVFHGLKDTGTPVLCLGGFLIGRTLAVLITMTLAISMAARQGPVAMAAHQICLQIWLAVSLLTDALAVSGQALIASSLSRGDYRTLREVTNLVLKIGLLTGVSLAAILGVSFGSLATLFTKDAEVLGVVRAAVLMVVGAISSAFLLYAASIFGLHGVWSGLALFMGLRMVAGCIRLLSKNGPWWFLHEDLKRFEHVS